MKKIRYLSSPFWKVDSSIQLQLGLMKGDEGFDLNKSFCHQEEFFMMLIRYCNRLYKEKKYTFEYKGAKLSPSKITRGQTVSVRIEMMESFIKQGIMQHFEGLGIRTLFLIDGNNYFRRKRKPILTSAIAGLVKFISELEDDFPNLKFLLVFDYSIHKLIDNQKMFKILWQSNSVIVSRQGTQADDIILDIHREFHERFNVKIVSRDNFSEFRASYDDFEIDCIPVQNNKELRRLIKQSILLDLI